MRNYGTAGKQATEGVITTFLLNTKHAPDRMKNALATGNYNV
jgi:hypothetical protein